MEDIGNTFWTIFGQLTSCFVRSTELVRRLRFVLGLTQGGNACALSKSNKIHCCTPTTVAFFLSGECSVTANYAVISPSGLLCVVFCAYSPSGASSV